MTKVIIIGLDGGSWDLIKPWADEGVLPTFKNLMTGGVWGKLQSTFPPITCPAWPSMLTEKKPDTLGLYYFTSRDSKSYNPKVIRAKRLNGSIWQLLSRKGKRCFVINVPMSELFNKIDINGVFVGDPILNIGDITDQAHVKSLIEDIGYRVEVDPYEKGKEKDYLKEIIKCSKQQFFLFEKLLNEDWDLFFYVHFLMDNVSHIYWKYIDEKYPEYQYNEEIISLIKRYYKEIDQFLELIMKKTSNLFIVSDHGFGPLYYEINLNQWLAREGFLKRKELTLELRRVKKNLRAWLIRVGNKPLLKSFAKKITPFLIPDYGKQIKQITKPFHQRFKIFFENTPLLDFINWSKTKAYSIYYG